MSAEQLIALQAAMADLSDLYAVARGFTSLHERAENELLPQLAALGRDLRALVRRGELDAAIEPTARQIMGLAADWQQSLQQVRSSAVYGAARDAMANDQQQELAPLLPQIFADLHPLLSSGQLFFPFSPASGQRKPGTSPFLTPGQCADQLLRLRDVGLAPEPSGSDWWEADFPYIECASAPQSLETPIWLCAPTAEVNRVVFGTSSGLCRIYSSCVKAPFAVGLAEHVTDEWWLAYEGSFRDFRNALTRELQARRIPLQP